MPHTGINEEALLVLLRSSRERVRLSCNFEGGVLEAILKTQELIRQSHFVLRSGETSALLKFHRDLHRTTATELHLHPALLIP